MGTASFQPAHPVIPADAGIHSVPNAMDPGVRRDDGNDASTERPAAVFRNG